MTLPSVYRPKGDLKIQKLRYAEQTGGRVTLTKPPYTPKVCPMTPKVYN